MLNMVFDGLVTGPFYRWADAQSIWEYLFWKYVNPSIDFEAKRILHLIIRLVSPLRITWIGQLVPTFRSCLSMDRILAFESLLAVKRKPKKTGSTSYLSYFNAIMFFYWEFHNLAYTNQPA